MGHGKAQRPRTAAEDSGVSLQAGWPPADAGSQGKLLLSPLQEALCTQVHLSLCERSQTPVEGDRILDFLLLI